MSRQRSAVVAWDLSGAARKIKHPRGFKPTHPGVFV